MCILFSRKASMVLFFLLNPHLIVLFCLDWSVHPSITGMEKLCGI